MHEPSPADARGVRFHASALAVGLVLALAVTWPLAMHITDAFPTYRDAATGASWTKVPVDQLLISWILASDVRRLGEDPLGVFDTNNMHPFRHTLAYSENFLGVALPVWPVEVIWANPVLTHNVALLVILALSAYGVILLVHELTGSAPAAVVAAVFATYASFVFAQIIELHTVAGLSTALTFFALVRVVRTRAWRHAVLLGAVTAWQLWASLHWGVFLALGLACAIAVLLATNADARRALPQLIGAGVIALLLIIPLAIPYAVVAREMDLRKRGFTMSLFFPLETLPPVTAPLAYLAGRLADPRRSMAFMALAPWLAMGAGLVASALARRPRVIPWSFMAAITVAAIVNFWYAWGPQHLYGLPSLYAMVSDIPGLGIVRAPARAVLFTSLMIAVLGGCGLAAVLRRVRSRTAALAIAAVAVLVAVVEAGRQEAGIIAAPVRLPVPPELATLPTDCAIAEVPSSFDVQALALFRSTTHWRPLVNGRSGFYPVGVFAETGFLNRFPEETTLEYLRDAGACAVLVRFDHDQRARTMVELSKKLGFQVFPLAPAYRATLVVFGGAAPAPADGRHLDRSGWKIIGPVPDARAPLDGSLDTTLMLSVTAPGGPEKLTIDLGSPAVISGVDLSLGQHFRHYLWSYRVETSADGSLWSTLAELPAAVPPLASYRADPDRIVQRIRFPPQQAARYLRIGPYRPPPGGVQMDTGFTSWGVAEIDVIGTNDRASVGAQS